MSIDDGRTNLPHDLATFCIFQQTVACHEETLLFHIFALDMNVLIFESERRLLVTESFGSLVAAELNLGIFTSSEYTF